MSDPIREMLWASRPDHFDGCWKHVGHDGCAMAKVYEVTAERDALAKALRELVRLADDVPDTETTTAEYSQAWTDAVDTARELVSSYSQGLSGE